MTLAAEQCRQYIEAKYPGTPIGRFACRNTASGGISQHSAYKGYDSNALDIYGPDKGTGAADTAHIQKIVDDLQSNLSAWSGRKILWQQAAHYDHAHIDFYPMITMHKWCGGPETPTWRLSNGDTVTTRNPAPENGAYDGSNDMDKQTSNPSFQPAWDKARAAGIFTEYTEPSDIVTAEKLAVFLDRAGLIPSATGLPSGNGLPPAQ